MTSFQGEERIDQRSMPGNGDDNRSPAPLQAVRVSVARSLESRPMQLHDTIAAIATAPGSAGLAVVRVSGPEALGISDRVFHGAIPLASAASHTLHHGWARRGGQ